MKHSRILAFTLAFLMCVIMFVGVIPTSVFAAKENFKTCGYIGIRGCAIPEAGQKPDFDVEENSPGQYSIMSVNWYHDSVSASNAVGGTETFRGNTVYIVEFEVWAKDAYIFTTDSNGYTTVVADISPNYAEYGEFDAQVLNVYGKDNEKYLTVRCTFPATESTATYINSISITGVEEPYAGDRAKYPVGSLPSNVQYLTDNRGYYYDVAWYDGSRKMTNQEYFEEGKTYSCHMAIKAMAGYEFRTDPNHFFASPGYPFPTVSVTINGKTATVLPDNSVAPGSEVIFVSVQFKCNASRKITHVDITNVDDPKADFKPDYDITCGDSTYKRDSLTNFAYRSGVAWMDKSGNYLNASSDVFAPSSTYTVEIRLEAVDPYVFAYTQMGSTAVTATVNGNDAVVYASPDGEKYLIVRYTFKKTTGLEVKKIEIDDLEAPKSGNLPDYTVTYGDTTYTKQSYSDEYTQNGVQWYNDTTRTEMRPGIDKFEGGNTYTVYIFIKTTGKYTLVYNEDDDSWSVSAKLNGKNAGTEEVYENTLTVWYSYTLPEDVHVCSPQKIEEVEATCTTDGKKEHYFCDECDKFFEDAKCTKEIRNFLTWGIIEAKGHTGGKATCSEKAVCKNCGTPYGELENHNFGSGWDYKDEHGHAHKCKVCGAHDTLVPHTAGEAKCGEVSKCTECKAEYGEVIQHQWSTTWDYADSKGHAHKCTVCGERDEVQEHSGGTADCQNKAKCSACGTEYGKTGEHKWSSTWDYTDSKGHAHKCTVVGCDEFSDRVKHTPGAEATETSPQTCTECGYIVKPATGHKHDLTKVKEKDPTCTENGNKQYYTCSGCDEIFADSKGNEEITDKSTLIIPATGHKLTWKATSSKHTQKCSVKGCGYVVEGSENEHQFDEDNVCVICTYSKKTGKVETEEVETTEPEETDEPETDAPENGKPPKTDETDAPETDKDGTTPGNNKTMWIITGAALIFGVVCLVLVTVILIKSSKKK